LQLGKATRAAQAPAVVGSDRGLEALADGGIDAVDQGLGHGQSVCVDRRP
jgi:hypothetical protein